MTLRGALASFMAISLFSGLEWMVEFHNQLSSLEKAVKRSNERVREQKTRIEKLKKQVKEMESTIHVIRAVRREEDRQRLNHLIKRKAFNEESKEGSQ